MNVITEKMKEEKMIEIYRSLEDKSGFRLKVARLTKRSHNTVRNWFLDKMVNFPTKDKRIMKILERELNKAPKK